jgi:O-antigen/teichoic acid export membrane protein
MKAMQQDTRMTLLSRIPVMLLSFLSIAVLTRWLGPAGNGIYTFVFANINLLLLLLGSQSDAATIHFLSKNDADQQRVISISLVVTLFSFLACLFLVLAGIYVFPTLRTWIVPANQPLIYFLAFIVISFLCKRLQGMCLAILRSTLRFTWYTRLQLLSQLIPAILYIIGFVVISSMSATEDVLLAFNFLLTAQVLITIISLLVVFYRFAFRGRYTYGEDYGTFTRFTLKSTIDALAKFINRRIDVYFVQAYRGFAALGQYGLASQVTNFIQEAIMPFTQVMNPYLVRSDEAGKQEIIARMGRIIFTSSLVLTLLIALLAPMLIPLLFGKAFAPAILATQILSLSVLISSMRIVFASYFQSINHLRFNILGNWLGVIITIILDIALIPKWGIEGAAVASILAYLTSLLFLVYHYQKITNQPLRDMLLLRGADIKWLFKK